MGAARVVTVAVLVTFVIVVLASAPCIASAWVVVVVAPALAFPFIPAVASSVFVCRTAPTKSRLVRTRWRVWARGAFRCPAWVVLTINAAEVSWWEAADCQSAGSLVMEID